MEYKSRQLGIKCYILFINGVDYHFGLKTTNLEEL